jgi:hypothetical protein
MTEPVDFASEVESGDRKRGLLALRGLLARSLEDAPARDLAALSRRLMQVMEELEQLGAGDDENAPSAEDELAERREAVLSAAGLERTAESG